VRWSEAIGQKVTIRWEGKYKGVVWNEVIGQGEGARWGVMRNNKVRQSNKVQGKAARCDGKSRHEAKEQGVTKH